MDRSFNVVMAQGAAGPVAANSFAIGQSDADKALEVEVAAMGTSCFVFAGRLSTTECQGILSTSGTNVDEVIAVCQSGGRVEARIDESVRAITVYLLANAPATPVGVTIRVRSCRNDP